jgi:hypothetical protein
MGHRSRGCQEVKLQGKAPGGRPRPRPLIDSDEAWKLAFHLSGWRGVTRMAATAILLGIVISLVVVAVCSA